MGCYFSNALYINANCGQSNDKIQNYQVICFVFRRRFFIPIMRLMDRVSLRRVGRVRFSSQKGVQIPVEFFTITFARIHLRNRGIHLFWTMCEASNRLMFGMRKLNSYLHSLNPQMNPSLPSITSNSQDLYLKKKDLQKIVNARFIQK